MPRPRKPNNLKILDGSRFPLRDNVEFLEFKKFPDAPGWLINSDAVDEYERLGKILFGVGLLTDANYIVLCHLANLHAKMMEIWRTGECPTGHMIAQYRNLVNDFGLTPVAQTKVKGNKVKKEENKFASIKRANCA